jgi:hypothetical protein
MTARGRVREMCPLCQCCVRATPGQHRPPSPARSIYFFPRHPPTPLAEFLSLEFFSQGAEEGAARSGLRAASNPQLLAVDRSTLFFLALQPLSFPPFMFLSVFNVICFKKRFEGSNIATGARAVRAETISRQTASVMGQTGG